MCSFSQIITYPIQKEVKISDTSTPMIIIDSTLKIGAYAGMLNWAEFPTRAMEVKGRSNLIAGVSMNYLLAKGIYFNSWAMIQVNDDASTTSAQRFWFQAKPIKRLSIELGDMASIPTEQRPLPITGDGQFEPTALQQITGGGIGIKMKYQITNNWELAGGVVERNKLPEYSGRVSYKKIVFSTWYSQWDTRYGSALSIKIHPVSTTIVWNQHRRISNILVINLSHDWSLYSDMGYDLHSKELLRGEWGILKSLSTKWINVITGTSWNNETKAVRVYCQIGL